MSLFILSQNRLGQTNIQVLKTMQSNFFCVAKGIKHIFCAVGDHRGCGLVERIIQTIKRKLGVMQLEENSENIENRYRRQKN